MSVSTRTNLATNPSAASTTGYLAVAGTGGMAALTNQTGTGAFGSTFNRTTWTVATTSPSGGASYTQGSLSPATQYSHQVWVRSSKAQTVTLSAQYQNSSLTNVGAPQVSAGVVLTANVWTQLKVEGFTSGAGVDRVVLTAAATGSNWAAADTLDIDAVLPESGPTCGTYFDGSFVNANSVMYGWVGAVNASTSTATTYMPAIALVAKPTFDPCPRVEITITDLTPTDNVVNVWRTADGKRQAVRGARKLTVNGSNAVIDYEVPLNRVVAYDLEITSGLNNGAAVAEQTTTVACATWCIQDPLVPSSAIALNVTKQDSSAPYLTAAAVKNLEYAAGVNIIPILGSPEPVALMGQRSLASGVDFSMFTNTAQVTTQLRNLIQQTPLLLVRSNGVRNDGIPGLAYYSSAKPVEHPVTVAFGGTLTNWQLTGELVAAPAMNVLVPVWTYGTVAALWSTYQAAQTALAGKTYLDVLKSPSGI